MRKGSAPLTDRDRAAVRAFGLVLPLLGAQRARDRRMSPAERYELGLALWRLQNPQALPPEVRPGPEPFALR